MCDDVNGAAVQYVRTQLQTLPDTDPTKGMYRNTQFTVSALQAQQSGDYARAIELLAPAANAPGRPPVGPPPMLRIHELLGAALLKAGRAQEAVAAYERALELTPNRSLALLGLARARAAAGCSMPGRTQMLTYRHLPRHARVGGSRIADRGSRIEDPDSRSAI